MLISPGIVGATLPGGTLPPDQEKAEAKSPLLNFSLFEPAASMAAGAS